MRIINIAAKVPTRTIHGYTTLSTTTYQVPSRTIHGYTTVRLTVRIRFYALTLPRRSPVELPVVPLFTSGGCERTTSPVSPQNPFGGPDPETDWHLPVRSGALKNSFGGSDHSRVRYRLGRSRITERTPGETASLSGTRGRNATRSPAYRCQMRDRIAPGGGAPGRI